MMHEEKVAYLKQDLAQRGEDVRWAVTPLYALLWRRGWMLHPPLFQSFPVLVLTMGGFYGVGMAVFFGFMLVGTHQFLVWQEALGAVLALYMIICFVGGLCLFGVPMAAIYRWKARKLALPSWENYPERTPDR